MEQLNDDSICKINYYNHYISNKTEQEIINSFAIDLAIFDKKRNDKGVLNHGINSFIMLNECNNKKKNEEKCYDIVIYFDLIAFKAYNDHLSHSAGTALIIYIANYFNTFFSKKAFRFTRFGGDEFLAYQIRECYSLNISGGQRYNSPEIFKKSQIFQDLQKVINNLEQEDITIIYPKNTSDDTIQVQAINSNDVYFTKQEHTHFHSKTIVSEKNILSHRIRVRGVGIRFGIGTNPKEANIDSSKRKETSKRGDFYNKVEFCVGVDDSGTQIWKNANDYIYFYIEGNSTNRIINKINKEFENKYDFFLYKDTDIDVTYFFIKKEKKSKELLFFLLDSFEYKCSKQLITIYKEHNKKLNEDNMKNTFSHEIENLKVLLCENPQKLDFETLIKQTYFSKISQCNFKKIIPDIDIKQSFFESFFENIFFDFLYTSSDIFSKYIIKELIAFIRYPEDCKKIYNHNLLPLNEIAKTFI